MIQLGEHATIRVFNYKTIQAGAELCQAQANLNLSSLCCFSRLSNYCILVGYAYVLSFRPVALQIRTIPGG